MSERTIDGLSAARARGRTGGQKLKLGPRQVQLARQMYEETGDDGKRRYTINQIAAEFGVTHPTIYRHLKPTSSPLVFRRVLPPPCRTAPDSRAIPKGHAKPHGGETPPVARLAVRVTSASFSRSGTLIRFRRVAWRDEQPPGSRRSGTRAAW